MSQTIQFNLPADRGAIGLICNNRVQNGDQFSSDGWVYNSGRRMRKWYVNSGKHKVWEPIYNDLAKLEARRWRIHQFYESKSDREFKPLWHAVEKAKRCIAPFGESWIRVEHHGGQFAGIGWTWLDEKPKALRRPDLAIAWMKLEDRMMEWGSHISMFDEAFRHGVYVRYRDAICKKHKPETAHLVINGRHYWFTFNPPGVMAASRGRSIVERLSYPEDQLSFNETLTCVGGETRKG